MYKLYFVRHGDASHQAKFDHERPLTETGQREIQRLADGLVSLGVELDRIYASPRVRAQQTADIIAGTTGASLETSEACNFDFDLQAVAGLLAGQVERQAFMFVGHNPSMSETVRAACGANISMKTGAVACVVMQAVRPGGGMLEWYLSPKVFKKLQSG